MSQTDLVPVDLDRGQAFLVYATMCGDVCRSAAALGIPEAAILQMVETEGWANKLGPILALKKANRPGSIEKAINRALNFTQSHQMRLIIQRAITRLTNMNDGEFEEYLFQEGKADKNGDTVRKLTTRAIADLSSALEKTHSMTYQALGDTTQDRLKAKAEDSSEDVSAGDLHAKLSAGLAAVRASCTPRAQLLDAQLAQAADIAAKAVKTPSPHDDDDH